MHDAGGAGEGQAQVEVAEGFGEAQVELVVHEPHGHLGNAGREFLHFDAVGLVYLHAGIQGQVHGLAARHLGCELALQNLLFQQAQLAVRHHQEVAAAAAGVEEAQALQAAMQLVEALAVLAGLGQLLAQLIQKQPLNHLENIGLRGVVRPQVAPLHGVRNTLKQRPKDGRRNPGPVEVRAPDELGAQGHIKGRKREELREQRAIDVRQRLVVGRQVLLPLVGRLVEHRKPLRQLGAHVGAVGAGVVFEEQLEGVFLEDGRVFGKQTEQDAHEQHFQLVAVVAAAQQGVVQLTHQLGRLNVGGVLGAVLALLVAREEREQVQVLVELLQREVVAGVFVEVVEAEAGEVGDEDVLGQLVVLEAGEVVFGLLHGLFQVAPPAFVLHEQGALPEQVHEALPPIELLDGHLKRGHAPPLDIEHMKKLNPERLGVGALIGGVLPLLGKANGAVFYLG